MILTESWVEKNGTKWYAENLDAMTNQDFKLMREFHAKFIKCEFSIELVLSSKKYLEKYLEKYNWTCSMTEKDIKFVTADKFQMGFLGYSSVNNPLMVVIKVNNGQYSEIRVIEEELD